MRWSRTREADGRMTAAECGRCGGEIGWGEEYYRVNGEFFCEDCLAEYARVYFAPFLRRGGEDAWQ